MRLLECGGGLPARRAYGSERGRKPADTALATTHANSRNVRTPEAGGTPALVDVAPGLAGPGPAADRLADLLAVAAHSGVGFGAGLVPRCTDADQVWSLLAGAVAAMTGDDVRAALAAPDPAALLALSRSAREAVRDVVTCVAVPADHLERVAGAVSAGG